LFNAFVEVISPLLCIIAIRNQFGITNMKTEENKKKVELNDEQLNDIAGGFQNHSKNQQHIPQ
jgi:hypothetical protein